MIKLQTVDASAEWIDECGLISATILAGSPTDSSVLLIGSARGTLPYALSHRYVHVEVCDPSARRLESIEEDWALVNRPNQRLNSGRDLPRLPFSSRNFDLIIVDTLALSADTLSDPSTWDQIVHALADGGRCFIAARNSNASFPWPSDGGDTTSNRQPSLSLRRLQAILHRHGLGQSAVYGLSPNLRAPRLIFDLTTRNLSRYWNRRPSIRERLASWYTHNRFRVPAFAIVAEKKLPLHGRTTGKPLQSVAETVLSRVAEMDGEFTPRSSAWTMRRVLLRNTGRMVIEAASLDDSRQSILVKLPYSPKAKEGDHRNAEALRSIHSCIQLSRDVKQLVPRHLGSGVYGGQPFFVEEMKDGVPLDQAIRQRRRRAFVGSIRSLGVWRSIEQTCQFLSRLHEATQQVTLVGEDQFLPVRQAMKAMRSFASDQRARDACDKIERFLETEILGRRIPFVWSHGDAGITNVMEDSIGALAGIVDWETFDKQGLPLSDLIMLSISQQVDKQGYARWTCLQPTLVGMERELFGGLPVQRYLDVLGMDRKIIPALAMSTWATYAGSRLEMKRSDPKWMRFTVHEPLSIFATSL